MSYAPQYHYDTGGPDDRLRQSRVRNSAHRQQLREAEQRMRDAKLAALRDEAARQQHVSQQRAHTARCEAIREAPACVGVSSARFESKLNQMARRERLCGSFTLRQRWRPALRDDVAPAADGGARGPRRELRGKDSKGRWWPLTVQRRNDDGTYAGVATDDAKGAQSREWPNVHIANIQVRDRRRATKPGQTLRFDAWPREAEAGERRQSHTPQDIATAVTAIARPARVVHCMQRRDGVYVLLDDGMTAAQAAGKMKAYPVRVEALAPAEDEAWRRELDAVAAGAEIRCGQRRAGTWKFGQPDVRQRLREETDAEYRTRIRFIDRSEQLLQHAKQLSDNLESKDAGLRWRKAERADVEVGRRGVLRARDARGKWWPVVVTAARADGTFAARAQGAGREERVWEKVYLGNIERRSAAGDVAAAGGKDIVAAVAELRASLRDTQQRRWDGAEGTAAEAWEENRRWRKELDASYHRRGVQAEEAGMRAPMAVEGVGRVTALVDEAARIAEEMRAAEERLVQQAAVALLVAAAEEEIEETTVAAVLAVACHEQWAIWEEKERVKAEKKRLEEEEWTAATLVAVAAVERAQQLANAEVADENAAYAVAVAAATAAAVAGDNLDRGAEDAAAELSEMLCMMFGIAEERAVTESAACLEQLMVAFDVAEGRARAAAADEALLALAHFDAAETGAKAAAADAALQTLTHFDVAEGQAKQAAADEALQLTGLMADPPPEPEPEPAAEEGEADEGA